MLVIVKSFVQHPLDFCVKTHGFDSIDCRRHFPFPANKIENEIVAEQWIAFVELTSPLLTVPFGFLAGSVFVPLVAEFDGDATDFVAVGISDGFGMADRVAGSGVLVLATLGKLAFGGEKVGGRAIGCGCRGCWGD